MKAIMRYEFCNIDDLVFVTILCFHQLCFLYYVQMNHTDNYLKTISQNKFLRFCQSAVKKYSKSVNLLVKINRKYIAQGFTRFKAFQIVTFLTRMQLATGLKKAIVDSFIKKHKPGFSELKEH